MAVLFYHGVENSIRTDAYTTSLLVAAPGQSCRPRRRRPPTLNRTAWSRPFDVRDLRPPSTYRRIWRDGGPKVPTAADRWGFWRVCGTRASVGSSRTTSPSGRTRLPGCRFISVRRSGPASRCAFVTRSRVIFRT